MAEKTLDARVCLKYDTYENWKSKNTVLKKGEAAQTYVSSTSTIDSTGKTLTASSSGTIPAGSVLYKVGDGTTAYNSLKFTTAIPTNATSSDFTDAHLVKWDANKNAFVDSGYTSDDIASKTYVDTSIGDKLSKSSNTYIVYGTDGSENQITIPYTANPNKDSIAKRYTDGRLRVGTPIEDSDAVTKLHLDTVLSDVGVTYNENILINGEFNVNQQGTTEYTISGSKTKTVDMWIGWNGAGTFNASTKVLTNTLGSSSVNTVILQQAIEYYDYLWGKTLTLSAKIDGTIYSVTGTLPSSAPAAKTYYLNKNITLSSGYSAYIRLRYETSTTMLYADVGLVPDSSSLTAVSRITLGFVKLEYGSAFTPIRRGGWNTGSEEIIKCQRYYQNIYTHDMTGYARNTTQIYLTFHLPVMMRTTPTLKETRTGTIIVGQGSSNYTINSFTTWQYFNNCYRMLLTVNSSTPLTQYQLYATNLGDFSLDANIY